jgi:hypothetical protein
MIRSGFGQELRDLPCRNARHARCTVIRQPILERIATMQDLNSNQLTVVVGGGAKVNDQITQQITALQTSLKDALSANNSNNGGGNNTFMLLAMMMAMRPPAATVVAGGGGPVVAAAAPSSVVNIRTRVRW